MTLQEIHVRPAKREDAVQISTLLKNLGLIVPGLPDVEKIDQFWDKLWDKNPYFTEFNMNVEYGWVMIANERIVGFFGCIPRVYCLGSQRIPVSIASLWGVEKEYRTYTHLLSDRFFNYNSVSLKIVTTAIKPTGRLFEKYGGRKVPCPDLAEVYMVPVDFSELLRHKFSTLLVKNSIGGVLFKIAQIFLTPWKYKYKALSKDSAIREITINEIPKDFDSFIYRCFKAQTGLSASRYSTIIEWYYSDFGASSTRRLFVCSDQGQTTGFISIIKEAVAGNSGLERYKVIDLVALSTEIKKRLIRNVLKFLADTGGHVLEFHHPGMIEKKEIPAFTLNRKFSSFPIYYQTADAKLDIFLQEKQNWQIMPFDGDTCLI